MSRLVSLAFSFAICLSLTSFAFAQKKVIASAVPEKTIATALDSNGFARLPVKRVVLYKNGVGYFEHNARVHGNQELAIDFTTGQLNDVLKSLTVVDLGEGHIGSVRYNSIAPLDERLRSLRLPFGEQVSSEEFLTALRGARVDVRSGASSATGRLLSVQKERRQNGKGDYVGCHHLCDRDRGRRNAELRTRARERQCAWPNAISATKWGVISTWLAVPGRATCAA